MMSLNTRWFLFSVKYSRLYRVHHKKHDGTLATNPPIHIYINMINNRLVGLIIDYCSK